MIGVFRKGPHRFCMQPQSIVGSLYNVYAVVLEDVDNAFVFHIVFHVRG